MKESRSLSSRLSSAQKHLIHALIQAAHNLSSTLLLGHEIPHFSLNFGLSATQTILIFSFRKFFINNYLGYPAVYSGFLLSALSLCISVCLYLCLFPYIFFQIINFLLLRFIFGWTNSFIHIDKRLCSTI